MTSASPAPPAACAVKVVRSWWKVPGACGWEGVGGQECVPVLPLLSVAFLLGPAAICSPPCPQDSAGAKPLCYLPLSPDLTTCCGHSPPFVPAERFASSCPARPPAPLRGGSHPNCSLTGEGRPRPRARCREGGSDQGLVPRPSPCVCPTLHRTCWARSGEVAGDGDERPGSLPRLSVGTAGEPARPCCLLCRRGRSAGQPACQAMSGSQGQGGGEWQPEGVCRTA